MPTTYTDQFWIMDPAYPPPAGTFLSVQLLELEDLDDDGQIERTGGETVDGSDIRRIYTGDTVTVQFSNGSTTTITGTTFYLADGREVFTPTDGSVLPEGTLVSTTYVTSQSQSVTEEQLGPQCFVKGTKIATPAGTKTVESLKSGQKVLAADGRELTVRKVLFSFQSAAKLNENQNLRPVRIVSGALGQGKPHCDLLVSRQHRMLVRSQVAQRMFGQDEVLISAIKLTELPGIYIDLDVKEVTYFHLVFDQHEVILAEGAETESLYLGEEALATLGKEVQDEIYALFPDLRLSGDRPKSARMIPPNKQTKRLIQRHAKNGRAALE